MRGCHVLVAAVEELDPELLTVLLKDSDLTNGADVVSVRRRAVGLGQVASCWELDLELDGDVANVAVVAKVPSADPVSVATANAQHLYEREVRFYRELAPAVGIRTPHCYAAAFDGDSGAFLLLLESITPVTATDQLVGLSLERAERAVRELAALHAPCWGTASASAPSFARTLGESLRPLFLEVVPVLFDGFLDRHGDSTSPAARHVVEWLRGRLGLYLAGRGGPRTVVHGDFRTDNLLFDGRGGAVPLATVDWQTVGEGAAALDVAYLLTTSLETEVRRGEEGRLLAAYHERLVELGVTGYDSAALYDDYVWHAFQGIVMLVCASMIVARTERGDAMFLSMIERAAGAVDDLDARRALEP